MTTRPSSWESPDDDMEGEYHNDPPSDAVHECDCCDGAGLHVIECEECWVYDPYTDYGGPEFCDCCVWGYRYYECEDCGGKGHKIERYQDYVRRKKEEAAEERAERYE